MLYYITMSYKEHQIYHVEAENKEEAINLVQSKGATATGSKDISFEVVDVEESSDER